MTRPSGAIRRILGLLAAGAMLAACGGETSDSAWAGFERSPTPEVSGLALPEVDAEGPIADFAFEAPEDGVLLVYFGFTSCPDVCPTTLADVGRTLADLGADGERVEVAMVTIDPEVDTPELLSGYVRAFVPSTTTVRALRTTDDAELRSVADVFGVTYGRDETDTVFHTSSLFAVDDEGLLRLTWPFGVTTDDLEGDLVRLLEET